MARGDGLVVARTSYATGNLFVHAGEVWAEDDPIVKNYPAAFRALVVRTTIPERAEEPKPAPTRRVSRRKS